MEDNIKDTNQNDKIEILDINKKVQNSFLNYAMSVIVARALPDVKDGLKPVQRRILYAMNEMSIYANSQYKKSARIVGEVMGKYHPHGDSSIYEAMVRMAQNFSFRYQLIDGHGNFGNIDGDGAAAMRYTEARMSKISMELLKDIDKDTVNFIDNYDGSEQEPEVLPSKIPNLLVNGSTGIAVGMATSIPPHNLGEVVDGIIAYIDNNDLEIFELMNYIKGPDFPTGCQILGLNNLKKAYETGNGSVTIRSKTEIITNEKNNKNSIVITEIPYMVNKTRLIEKIAELVKTKKIDGITNLTDESNRKGIRIVIDLRKDINPNVMLNNLYKNTQLQTSFSINMVALVNNSPKTLNLKEIIEHFVKFQIEILVNKTKYDLKKSKDRLHIVEGYIIAYDNLEEVIKIIRNTIDGTEKEKLIKTFNLSDIQAGAILDMQLKRLSGLNISKINEEKESLIENIKRYNFIIENRQEQLNIIKDELKEIKDRYSDDRKSEVSLETDINIENEDLIPVDDVIITITNQGYVKRLKTDIYKVQNRGGVGITGIKTKDDDEVINTINTCTHDYLYFFTNKGRVYSIKGYQIPEASRNAKGTPIINIINLQQDEKVATITRMERELKEDDKFLVFATKKGTIKRTSIKEYLNVNSNGKIAIKLLEDDELLKVLKTNGDSELMLGSNVGKSIRIKETNIRECGRNSIGVRGMRLKEKECIVGFSLIDNEHKDVLVITEKGFGKRTNVDEYRIQSRGGTGVKTLNVTEKNGYLSTLTTVNDNEDLIITTDKGMTIRVSISQISQTGRSAQGVRIIKLKDDHTISSITIINKDSEVE